jgi:hypothetical protein
MISAWIIVAFLVLVGACAIGYGFLRFLIVRVPGYNRVWALGRDTHLRIYPNFGAGIRVGKRLYMWSVVRGFEIMEWRHPVGWVAVYSKFVKKFTEGR